MGVAAVIATNTTLSREGLNDRQKSEAGGLSGRPLFARSTRVLARLYRETGGALPLIGVGGVGSAAQAYAKIRAGALAVQLYTAMVYRGLSLAHRIARGLDEMLVHRAADAAIAMHRVSGARVPTRFSKLGKVHVFRPEDGAEEHYAIEVGSPDRGDPVLSRLHSACFTGDVIGSLKCDCGPQLAAAMDQIAEAGHGVMLYMNQEGRGIGLANKMRAYALQDQGYDTVEANHRLGFEDDERDFRLGAEILKALGFNSVRLMTNNPGKIAMMETSGVSVAERVALKVGETDENKAYLATKAAKSGHLL